MLSDPAAIVTKKITAMLTIKHESNLLVNLRISIKIVAAFY